METIAEVEGADDEDLNVATQVADMEVKNRRSKSKADKKSQSNDLAIDPSDQKASDDFDDLESAGQRVLPSRGKPLGTREAFQSRLK